MEEFGFEQNNLGGYTQNKEPTGPLESLSNLNQQAGQAILNLGGKALEKYDQIEQEVLPMRRPAIQGTADWVDNNLTSLLQRFKLTEPYAEKTGDIAGLTTDVGLEIFSPGLEETAAATLTAGAALSPLPVIDEGLGALATGGLYGKNVVKRAAKEIPNYQRILNGIFDGSWKRVDGERVFVTTDGVRIDANNIDLNPNIMQSKGGGIRRQVLEDRLNDPRIEKFLTGQGTLRSKELSNLVQEFADRDDFMSVVSSRLDQLKEKYPHLVRQLDNQKETIALRWHHVNPSKGPVDLYIGLTAPADRAILRNHLVDKLGVFSGNHPLNNRGLSIDVHDQIHDWLGTRIGLRADVLKHKWAQKMGIDVGDLQPGTGFMANHLTLSPQGKAAFDAWFSNLKPHERLPFIEEYGKIIKESEGILGDLMKQYDSLFAVPEGFQLTPDNEVLLKFLESIPTDGSRLLQKDMKAIVEQVNREMPRGTLDLIQTSTGRVTQLNLESDVYKRIQEVKLELDAAKDLRTQRSLKAELKNLEKGILQKSLDIEGAIKQGGWNKRLEQERLRREGK
tara:strand:+ start:70 stop:1758 length:1689 start_codon:yes stop_codon:yes gene_type:complete